MSPNRRVRASLRDHAAPLPAATDDSDLLSRSCPDAPSSLPACVDGARIVGLGEATHGTEECFRHKNRLIRHLVIEEGFRTVAFEADAAAVTALDAFVRDADNTVADVSPDASAALGELDMWQWQTESVRDLLGWLRGFNDGRAPDEQVRVRGVDLSSPSAPARPLRVYFERVNPDVAASEALRTVAGATVPEDDEERERTLDAVAAAADNLTGRLDANRETYEAATSADAWRETRHHCRVVEQACEWARVRHEQPGPHLDGMAIRDRFMAENALWALDRDSGAGVALWAHDGHVQRGTFDDGSVWADATTMGERLARELGEHYRPIGFDFARGSFRAVGAESGAVETFEVDGPVDDTATATLAAIEEAPYLLDLRAAAADDRLDSWLSDERRTRYVGSVCDPAGDAEAAYAETDLPASFDCLLFVPESTSSAAVGSVRSQNP